MPRTPLQALIFVLSLWLALFLLQPVATGAAYRHDPADRDPRIAALEADLHASINAVRRDYHLALLRREAFLDAVARAHARDMAARHYLSHDTPEGLNPVDRLQRGQVTGFTMAGENVGLTSRQGHPTGEILNGWLLSPIHRDNVLAPAFNATGVGIARAADGTLYYTQVYVTFPRS